jgi:hypothetical protein
LFLNVLWLVADWNLCKTREIDEGECEDIWGKDSQVDGDWRNAGILASFCVCFANDFVSYF